MIKFLENLFTKPEYVTTLEEFLEYSEGKLPLINITMNPDCEREDSCLESHFKTEDRGVSFSICQGTPYITIYDKNGEDKGWMNPIKKSELPQLVVCMQSFLSGEPIGR